MKDIWRDGIYGLIVGDALGVPVEFTTRQERKMDPVTDMREYGTHNQPKGTWSDDSSMVLATLDSIKEKGGLDYADMMGRFNEWWTHGEYTPFGNVFDIGIATQKAIAKFGTGADISECGSSSEWDNGNGSLMRILPVCLYLYERQKKICTSEDESIYALHMTSALTHGHLRSQIACGIYYFLVKAILDCDGTLINRLQIGINNAFKYYRHDSRNNGELIRYERISDLDKFRLCDEAEIKSSGYVVATLEAAIWCLVNSDNYEQALLKAVNLGDDTDTVGAVTGGLAGLYYGYDMIPEEWIGCIQRKDWIDSIISK